MKSLQVLEVIGNYTGFSELQVLHSGAGFYIGTTYTDPETGFVEPGSRDSCYFVHKEVAMQALGKLEDLSVRPDLGEDEAFIAAWEDWLIKEGLDPNCVGYRLEP